MHNPSSTVSEVVQFCLEHAEAAPLAKRISLYRGLALLCSSESESATLKNLADELESADNRCREFAFRFKNGGRS